MYLLTTLLTTALIQQTFAIPLSESALSIHRPFKLIERGTPPPQCAKADATEKEGCFTLKGASNEDVRFALATGEKFGEGASGFFGHVAKCVRKDGEDIAVKQYDKANDQELADHSFDILRQLDGNDYIVKAIARGKVDNKPALAMELVQGGTLLSRIEKGEYKGKANENAMKKVAEKLLDGLVYMHSKKIAHMDIKAENVVFEGETPKFIDFDLACKDKTCVNRAPAGGDWGMQSPEAYLKWGADRSSVKVDPLLNDVWTLASLFIHMTTGVKLPNVEKNAEVKAIWSNAKADERVKLIQGKWHFHPEFAELLGNLFCKEAERLTIEEFKKGFQGIQMYC